MSDTAIIDKVPTATVLKQLDTIVDHFNNDRMSPADAIKAVMDLLQKRELNGHEIGHLRFELAKLYFAAKQFDQSIVQLYEIKTSGYAAGDFYLEFEIEFWHACAVHGQGVNKPFAWALLNAALNSVHPNTITTDRDEFGMAIALKTILETEIAQEKQHLILGGA